MSLDPVLAHLLLTVVLSFLVGLEIRTYKERFHPESENLFFGTARTYTFTGILGFVFYILDPKTLIPYTAVLLGLSLLYALFYRQKLADHRQSILLYLVLLCVYAFGPLSMRFPLWLPALLFVLIVFILNAKRSLHRFTPAINPYEFETLGKMVLLSAVILPLLPDRNVIPYVPLSPFKIWLAVVVISAISYGGYILQKYFFPHKGYFVTGVIGGTYSSTATTVVLARKLHALEGKNPVITAAIIAATSMMYLRLIVVALIFNLTVAEKLAIPFVALALAGMVPAWWYLRRSAAAEAGESFVDRNPLELGTAFLFAFLFVAMMMITQYVTGHFGDRGLQLLSFVVGFTDIDPFVLSILTGKYSVTTGEVVAAVMIAAGSNNILKAAYALWFGGLKNAWPSALWIALLGVMTILWGMSTSLLNF